jgi:methionyl-tRNA formyltransferase
VFGVLTEPVSPRDTSGDLLARLAVSGARLLIDTLDGIESGQLCAVPQPEDGISYAPKISPEDGRVDWGQPAVAIDRLIRACTPEPGAWTEFGGARLKLGPVQLAPPEPAPAGPDGPPALAPGELHVGRRSVLAGTATGPVTLGLVQPPGKRLMPAADWARGLHQSGPAAPKLG